ncbi:MAG TPA: PCRF domain-containing protein, partial [Thermoanaerobaculia bacterium]|nr:PCRF domain-containing protein [Thermoanaerobaculia bacterium]
MQKPGFWDDPAASAPIVRRRKAVERRLKTLDQLRSDEDDLAAWSELIAEGETDPEVTRFLDRVDRDVSRLDLELKLSGPDDDKSAIVAIHPGAGGTESQDWADMLLRMYLRWAERSDYEVEMLDRLDGEEAGIKSATFAVRGDYAYGYLNGENGVHRLVRISPFDSQSRRHT